MHTCRGLLLMGFVAVGAFACSLESDGSRNTQGRSPSGAGGTGAGGDSTATLGGGGDGATGAMGAGAGPSGAVCDPADAGWAADASCGIFVGGALGDDANPGTREAPLRSLQAAIDLAAEGKMRVYACDVLVVEAIRVHAGIDLRGGLDCEAFAPTGQKTTIEPEAGMITSPNIAAVQLMGGDATTSLTDIAVRAMVDTSAPSGASSMAMLAQSGAVVVLEGVDLFAGLGADGVPGATPVGPGPNGEGMTGADGAAGSPGCLSQSPVAGGTGGTGMCGGVDVSGGIGGSGVSGSTGGAGTAGEPALGAGLGGVGQSLSLGTVCVPGGVGIHGIAGQSGIGAFGVGELGDTGIMSPPATDGATAGLPGYGGGGGGGAHKCATGEAGASAGGGGAGGCGGLAGLAGGPGGSSLGLLSHGADVKLANVTITTSMGGMGGVGGDGQLGGLGGVGGAPGGIILPAQACMGGAGGMGGRGGSGGGGLGGHSIAVAFSGVAPDLGAATAVFDLAGVGGIGGDADVNASGAPGQACTALDFGTGNCLP